MKAQTEDFPRLVLVEWLDSRSPEPGWRYLEDGDMPSHCKCVSVGYLVKDDTAEKIIAQSIGDVPDGPFQVNGLMAIPASAITAMRPLGPS